MHIILEYVNVSLFNMLSIDFFSFFAIKNDAA